MTDYVLSAESEILLNRSISPLIRLDTCDAGEVTEMIQQSIEINRKVNLVCRGELSLWELCEELESYPHDMDNWTDEIMDNLEDELNEYGSPEAYVVNGSQW